MTPLPSARSPRTAAGRMLQTLPRNPRLVGSGAAIAALFLIGTSAPVAGRLTEYPVLSGQAIRFSVAVPVLLGVLLWRGHTLRIHLNKWDGIGVLALGLVGIAGFNVCLVSATRQADPALVGTVLAAAPVALAVLGPALQHRRPSRRLITGCLLITLGTAAATGLGNSSALGVLLCLAALACEIMFSLLAVPLIDRLGTLRTTTYAVTAAVAWLWAASLITNGAALPPAPTRVEGACLLYLAVVIGVLANLLWYAALPRIGADHAGLFYACTPLGALAAGLALHTSTPGLGELAGFALIAGGLLLGLAPRHRARNQRIARKPVTNVR